MFTRKPKIFCIGFNKTGTSSLHDFFKACGLSSRHHPYWPYYSHIKYGHLYFNAQCYSDGEQSNFVNLDAWFPESLFLLNNRDESDWLRSRIKHVMRFNENVDRQNIFTNPKYGKMAIDFYTNERESIKKWVSERRLYIQKAKLYFHNSNNFLEIDVTKQPDWGEQVFELIKASKIPLKTETPPSNLHSNKRPEELLIDQDRLKYYLSLIEEITNRD